MTIGICKSRKSGHTDTVIDTAKPWRCWKCVDITYKEYNNNAVRQKVKEKDYFGVCDYCADFHPK